MMCLSDVPQQSRCLINAGCGYYCAAVSLMGRQICPSLFLCNGLSSRSLQTFLGLSSTKRSLLLAHPYLNKRTTSMNPGPHPTLCSNSRNRSCTLVAQEASLGTWGPQAGGDMCPGLCPPGSSCWRSSFLTHHSCLPAPLPLEGVG